MKQGCLFDLDGTLIDSIVDLGMATNAVLQKHGLPVYDIKEYHMMVGNGVKKLMERALGQDHLDILDECLNEFYEYYGEHCLDHTQPYPGIVDMIIKIKNTFHIMQYLMMIILLYIKNIMIVLKI